MSNPKEDADDSESFEDSYSDDDKNHQPMNHGLGHVRRLEHENTSNVINSANSSKFGRELKLIGEPSSKKIKISNSAEYTYNKYIPTPLLLNQSDAGKSGAGGDTTVL